MATDTDAKDAVILALRECLYQFVDAVDGSYICVSHGSAECGHRIFPSDLLFNVASHARHVLRGEPCPVKMVKE